MPDERWGETPAVVAVTDGRPIDGRTVLDACEGVLADFKLPRYLVVRDTPLPRNMSKQGAESRPPRRVRRPADDRDADPLSATVDARRSYDQSGTFGH